MRDRLTSAHEIEVAHAPRAAGRILVVEDDESFGALLERELAGRGFDVMIVRDAREAPSALAFTRPDLAIIDLMVPLDVFTFVLCLRRATGTPDLPVVFVRARTDARDVATRFGVGARQYVNKSSGVQTLLDKVERVMVAKAA